jgi:hypothetical protein
MSTMQLFPDLPECLASDLACVIGRVAEPYRSCLESLLKALSHSELADLKSGLAGWFAGMKPEGMISQYTLIRQLILDAKRIYGEEVSQ